MPGEASADAELVVGDEGVTLTDDTVQLTTRFDECVAALEFADGPVTLFSVDGTTIDFRPDDWIDGVNALATIKRVLPPDVVCETKLESTYRELERGRRRRTDQTASQPPAASSSAISTDESAAARLASCCSESRSTKCSRTPRTCVGRRGLERVHSVVGEHRVGPAPIGRALPPFDEARRAPSRRCDA